MADHVKFVPYGKSVNCDPERMQYMRDMKGYCKSLLLPGFAFFEEQKGSALPKHLAEVSRLRSENVVNISPWDVGFHCLVCRVGVLCRPP